MDGLYKGRILYTKEGEAAVGVSYSEDEFSVSYKGKIYRRKADVIGQKLFFKIPQKVREGDSVVLLNIDSGEHPNLFGLCHICQTEQLLQQKLRALRKKYLKYIRILLFHTLFI